MKIINSGIKFEIYPNNIRTFDKLPTGSYAVRYTDDEGFYLVSAPKFKPLSEKVYGRRDDKIDKVFRGYGAMDRSLGILLTGDKGIGKSLFARMLSLEAYERDIPTIIIDTPYRGQDKYLSSIEQECLIMFDEFEKVFDGTRGMRQDDWLGFFDGVSQQKHLFVVTSNSIEALNEFLVNRPGRFHYHFRFEYPSSSEITEYMEDNLKPIYHHEIASIIKLSSFTHMNYDCLRAIATELNFGLSLNDALSDINIINVASSSILLKLNITLESGEVIPLTTWMRGTHEDVAEYVTFENERYALDMTIDLMKAIFVNGKFIFNDKYFENNDIDFSFSKKIGRMEWDQVPVVSITAERQNEPSKHFII